MRGNSKYLSFLLFPFPPLFLLLSFWPLLSLFLSVPSSLIPLHQLPPIQTLLHPHHTEPYPGVVVFSCFPLPRFCLPLPLSFLPLPLFFLPLPLFFPILSFRSLNDVFPSWPLSSYGRR